MDLILTDIRRNPCFSSLSNTTYYPHFPNFKAVAPGQHLLSGFTGSSP